MRPPDAHFEFSKMDLPGVMQRIEKLTSLAYGGGVPEALLPEIWAIQCDFSNDQ